MLTLNLVYPEKSDIKYTITRFSDSQIYFKLEDNDFLDNQNVTIWSRISWNDVQIIIAAYAALREAYVDGIHLYVPYFLGGRSDRKFLKGGNNYIKDIISPIINQLGFSSVLVLDPHSDVVEACISNLDKNDNVSLVTWALNDIYDGSERMPKELIGQEPCVLVSPDAGALKKIYNVAESIKFEGDIIVASKHREIKTGKILSTEVPIPPHIALKANILDFIIIDDICDGGRTFIEISKKIKDTFPGARVYLIVTHGIFSQGLLELGKWFTGIYTTNSIKDLHWTILDHEEEMKLLAEGFIKQLNVFE